MSTSEDFEVLISAYLDGVIEPQQLATLEELLLRDAEFAREFSYWCLTHRQVVELSSEDRLHALFDAHPTGAPGLPRKTLSFASAPKKSGPAKFDFTSVRRWASWAAAVCVGLGIGSWWWRHPTRPQNAARSEVANDSAIATVTRLVDVTWTPKHPVHNHGDALVVGDHVRLSEGRAKITFDCGAEVVLEGPCDFELQSQMIGKLHSGKLTADVPPRAFAFAILCPGVDLVDLGTSFGVEVNDRQQTQLHVFEGEVLCNPAGESDEQSELVHVTEQNARKFSPVGAEDSSIKMDSQQFEQLISLRRPTVMGPAEISPDQLALWLSADATVTVDSESRVAAWCDRLGGDNTAAEDAVQPKPEARPELVPKAINGLPAVRFDGESDYLVTTPLPTTDDQTVLIVAQFSKASHSLDRKWGGQILNYDGPPSRYLSDTLEPGVLQIGEPLLESQFHPAQLTGQVFAGFIGSTTVEAGRIDAEPLSPNVPFVLSYRYDFHQGQAELIVNGRSYGTSRAFAPQGITSHKIIGRHAWMELFFGGDLAELAIYNTAQSDLELRANTELLARKYGIPLASP